MLNILLELLIFRFIIVVKYMINGNTLSDRDFIDKFEDYTNSFFDAIQRTTNKS